MNARERCSGEDRHQQRRRTPSFSSSLLDAIYRSIDESKAEEEPELVHCRETTTLTRKKQINAHALEYEEDTERRTSSLRRAIMKEKWMESRSNRSNRSSSQFNSNSSSSESGIFSSSSETESGCYRSTPRSTAFTMQVPKQARDTQFEQATPKREGRFIRTTKSRALKIYGDLKKVKQPISPGGRIASFLNSIFNSKSAKKPKLDDIVEHNSNSIRKSRSVKDSATASFSRSCLSKTPTSRGKSSSCGSSNGLKRSVRFYPVSVIVDEDSRPCGHKNICEDDPSLMPMPISNAVVSQFREKRNAPQNSFRSYHQVKNVTDFEFRKFADEDDDDDDAESCVSSDLFELVNFGAVGARAYGEELPVYGTTDPMITNQSLHF